MQKISSKPVAAEEIAEMADREEDISAHFMNQFTVVRPVQRVNVDFATDAEGAGSAVRNAYRQSAGRDQDHDL